MIGRSPRFAPLRAGLALAMLFAMAGSALAQLRVRLAASDEDYIQYEAIKIKLTIANDSAVEAVLGRYEENARVTLLLQKGVGNADTRLLEMPSGADTVVKGGAQSSLTVDLTQLFDLREERRYALQATVMWHGKVYRSDTIFVNVVAGIVVDSVRRGLPQQPEVERDYVLRYLERGRHEHLFLSVLDLRQSVSLGVFDLGSLVRVYRPVIKFDNGGNVHVIHHAGNDENTHSFLISDEQGVRLLSQQRRTLDGKEIDAEESVAPTNAPAVPDPPAEKRAKKWPKKKNKVER